MPERTPDRLWYTPLLLIRHEPESLSARIPCPIPPALRGADTPTTVIGTARAPQTAGGLAITHAGDFLTVKVGEQVREGSERSLARRPGAAHSDCG